MKKYFTKAEIPEFLRIVGRDYGDDILNRTKRYIPKSDKFDGLEVLGKALEERYKADIKMDRITAQRRCH